MVNDLAVVALSRSDWEIVKLALSEWKGLCLEQDMEVRRIIVSIREQTSSVPAAVPALPMPRQGRSAGTCKHGIWVWERCAECESPADKASNVNTESVE